MGKVIRVDYESIPSQAKSIRESGEQINALLINVYNQIGNMNNCWYGKRYNTLVKEFNEITETINQLLNLVVGEIPYALECVANNYSQAVEDINVVSANNKAPKTINKISITNKNNGVRFMSKQVNTIKETILSDLQKVCDYMNSINSKYGNLRWNSEVSDSFKNKLQKISTDVVSAIDSIKSEFSNLVIQAQNDMQSAENNSMV